MRVKDNFYSLVFTPRPALKRSSRFPYSCSAVWVLTLRKKMEFSNPGEARRKETFQPYLLSKVSVYPLETLEKEDQTIPRGSNLMYSLINEDWINKWALKDSLSECYIPSLFP